ncbi:hypothetical protein HD806DRAFT_324747 [Xylariaceae sp. AK1471]|nr:hypothetical protein HD806DRAFT_324747 [Xylariaceae sp. AK1471]
MLTPAVISYISQFYALGNTPAVSLTRALPHGVDADILLLGCGDVRNVLYTAYTDLGLPPRKLDITCCDIEPAIIARNVLLFSLLIDGVTVDAVMDIYFHLYIDPRSHDIVKRQAEKLAPMMSDLDEWQRGPYGYLLDFCDQGSLTLVEPIMQKYAAAKSDATSMDALSNHLDHSKRLRQVLTGQSTDNTVLTGIRSAAPLAVLAAQHLPSTYQHFWEQGTFLTHSSPVVNPLFSESLSENVALHYGTDPTLGFHLATAFAQLAPSSPFRVKDSTEKGLQRIIEAARSQFHEWAAAYKKLLEVRPVLRFAVADALSFSHTLQCASSKLSSSANLFRRQLDPSPLVLNLKAYGKDGYAPSTFDVIDTSNLTDHLGALNLLVAASPLLKDSSQSTVYLEALVKMHTTPKAQFDALLRGHAPSISLLLGLAPVEYWTGATSTYTFDELLLSTALAEGQPCQAHSRFSFKLAKHFLQKKPSASPFSVAAQPLAGTMLKVYLHMFQHEDGSTLVHLSREEIAQKLRASAFPAYHRGSFVTILKLMQTHISTDWPSFWDLFWEQLRRLRDNVTSHDLYFQELAAQLHLQGLHTETWLEPRVHPTAKLRGPGKWKEMPEVVCVTLVVPREHVNQLYSTEYTKTTAPTLEGIVDFSGGAAGGLSRFSSAQVAFGSIERQGNLDDETAAITIKPDLRGWQGTSDMTISFYVPTNILLANPDRTQVGLGVQQTIANMGSFRHLEEHMKVYTTPLSDDSQVFISKFLPGMVGYPMTCSRVNIAPIEDIGGNVSLPTKTVTSLTLNGDRIDSFCCHVDFLDDISKKPLAGKASIELRQSSPTVIEIAFGKEALPYPISFPAPVSKEGAKTRIARKSSYIEVIASFAEPLVSDTLKTTLYPVTLGPNFVPVVINGHQVNLDSLPILSVGKSYKKSSEWITTLMSNQFSLPERKIRSAAMEAGGLHLHQSLRINLKDSLFTIFMLSTGLQGGQTGLFSLNHPTEGNCILIFVRSVRLDGAAATIVADAVCLPLTQALLDSNAIDTFLLVLRELQICAIKVDDEELALWKILLPAMAERCRTWNHKSSCEYRKPGATVPLSMEMGEAFMCSCGNGQLPESYMNLPEWDEAAKYLVRLAISPTFPVPYLEPILDPAMKSSNLLDQGVDELQLEKCRTCSATEAKNGKKLLKCSRCHEVSYCSSECQKKDWKTHRMECSS